MVGYNEQTWVNGESQANAQRFNHMEAGIKNAYNVSLIAITNIEPSECNEGDKYFNTSDNLIYTATDTDTWSETGETPISDKTYVLLEDGSTYMYDGTTLTRIGGSQVENEYSESTENAYNCKFINGETLYVDNEGGNIGEITLSDDIENYSRIKIFYNSTVECSYEFKPETNSVTTISLGSSYKIGSLYVKTIGVYNCQNDTLTPQLEECGYLTISTSGSSQMHWDSINYCKIKKVIGYKY